MFIILKRKVGFFFFYFFKPIDKKMSLLSLPPTSVLSTKTHRLDSMSSTTERCKTTPWNYAATNPTFLEFVMFYIC